MSSTKTSPIQRFKALDDSTGEFEAVVSIYGTIDLQGDVTMPGAHTKTIENWRKSGNLVPVVWSHDWSNPFAHIGWLDPKDMHEVIRGEKSVDRRVEGGLFVKGHLDVDKPFAKQVYDLLKAGRVKEWSWAYDVVRQRTASDGATELLEVNLFEVGPTLKGAHPDTLTLAVKSDDRQTERAKQLDRERLERNAALRELAEYNQKIAEAEATSRKSNPQPDRVDAFLAEIRAEKRHEKIADTTAVPGSGPGPRDWHDSRFAREQKLAERERMNDEVIASGVDPLWEREEELARQERARDEVVARVEVPR